MTLVPPSLLSHKPVGPKNTKQNTNSAQYSPSTWIRCLDGFKALPGFQIFESTCMSTEIVNSVMVVAQAPRIRNFSGKDGHLPNQAWGVKCCYCPHAAIVNMRGCMPAPDSSRNAKYAFSSSYITRSIQYHSDQQSHLLLPYILRAAQITEDRGPGYKAANLTYDRKKL